ncbi:MAG: phosphoesterase [Acidobacteriota bacterium]|nr:phosphoesterase [Acidobacteriota bacterium]
MRIRILYHDHCFDGAASAAFFTRFQRGAFHPDAEFSYTGMAHKASQMFEDGLFDGDENAIVDFKYSSNPRLTWWFDHHQSAFLTPEDAQHYARHRTEKQLYDPSYKSCTKFIRTVARNRFGFEAPDLDELVKWADIIDGAQYSDAKTAVELGEPAMKLTLVIEGSKGSETVQKIIGWMRDMRLAEIVALPEVQAIYQPLYQRHLKSVDMIRERASENGGVITFDLSGYDIEGYNKFIPYYLFPRGTYTVAVSPSSFRTKISVGSNPWAPAEPTHNLATICERYGGGGHARVGAISLEPGAIDQARTIAAEVAEELKT